MEKSKIEIGSGRIINKVTKFNSKPLHFKLTIHFEKKPTLKNEAQSLM